MGLITKLLQTYHTFAVVGVSQDPAKYGHEVFAALLEHGYTVYPVNPKYEQVDGHPCYPSLTALPVTPEVAVLIVPPAVTETLIPLCHQQGVKVVWMPPGAWSPQAVVACEQLGLEEVHDVCLVFSLRSL